MVNFGNFLATFLYKRKYIYCVTNGLALQCKITEIISKFIGLGQEQEFIKDLVISISNILIFYKKVEWQRSLKNIRIK